MSDEILVMRLELPLELAPNMNRYSTMSPWQRSRVRANVDSQILKAKKSWPQWDMGVKRTTLARIAKGKIKLKTTVTGGRMRLVKVTRHSSKSPDELGEGVLSCDVLGGKIPIDRLVQAGVLHNDSRRWLIREGRWISSPPSKGKVVIEVIDIAPGPEGALMSEQPAAPQTRSEA